MSVLVSVTKSSVSQTVDSKVAKVVHCDLVSFTFLCHASHQFAHAALLSHSVFTLVVEAHLAGFAAEAVLCCVSRQEHHMLGCCT